MSRPQVLRVAALAFLAFVLIGSYELIRGSAEAVYIHQYGSEAVPVAWLGVAGASFVVVAIYSRFVHATHLMRLLAYAALIFAGLLVTILVARHFETPGATYVLYVLKDVYIVVLIEIFWSYANVTYDRKTARWIYGLFCGMGSFGGAVGAMVTSVVAQRYGASFALWMLVPVLVGVGIGCYLVPSETMARAKTRENKSSFADGIATVRASRYLLTMLALIGTVQLVITLVDYQFNAVAGQTYTSADELAGVLGRVYSVINIAAVALQILTGPILKFVGVAATLIAIPCLLGGSLLSFEVAPLFVLLAVAKVLSKSLDYSLFRAAKEILYIPLGYDEKTKGKAVVDMLTYRVAKGFASVTVLGLVGLQVAQFVGIGTIVLVSIWIVLAVSIGRQYLRRTAA